MVDFSLEGDLVTIEVVGVHIIWALKKRVVFDKKNIKYIKEADKNLKPAPLRIPGTYVPKVIIAGTYRGKNRKEFWDVTYKKKWLEIGLDNEKYTKIVVEVEDVESVINMLK